MPQKLLKFDVYCPAEQYKIRKMYMYFTEIDGKPFPLPCPGCDFMSGAKICEECKSNLTMMFYRDPDPDLSKPLHVL